MEKRSWLIHQSLSTTWTKDENELFESALVFFDEKTPNRWFKVAAMIPGKSIYDVINQYRELVADVSDIEDGLVPIQGYLASWFTLELAHPRGFDVFRKKTRNCDQERKKGVPWTKEEHRQFLLGLEKHGKGDWRNISRNCVFSKTPTQVARHAQKYYLRLLSGAKEKKRPSIHDITTVSLNNTSQRIEAIKQNEVITSAHNPSSKIVMNWNDKNVEVSNLTVFDGDSFVAYLPHNIVKHNIHSRL